MNTTYFRPLRVIWLLLFTLLVGCATFERPPLPGTDSIMGQLNNLGPVRFWGDEDPVESDEYVRELRAQIVADNPDALSQPQYFLALSGGGQNGAFGAGLLNGMTQHGDRPVFRLVSGISTGAIIAPFAFLGPDYDDELKEMFNNYSSVDVLKRTILSGIFGGSALADSTLLLGLFEKYMDDAAIDRIGIEHQKGRRLLVGTTNMDALRPVIWDIGAIAAGNNPLRYQIIRRIILASASIPGAFPPVLFDVELDGVRYNELHMDGGVGSQIFLLPMSLDNRHVMDQLGFKQGGIIYVIRNGQTHKKWKLIKPTAFELSTASLGGLMRNQGNSNQYVINLLARLNGMQCQSACIPTDFEEEPDEPFDKDYMSRLYDLAFSMAKEGYPWVIYPGAED